MRRGRYALQSTTELCPKPVSSRANFIDLTEIQERAIQPMSKIHYARIKNVVRDFFFGNNVKSLHEVTLWIIYIMFYAPCREASLGSVWL